MRSSVFSVDGDDNNIKRRSRTNKKRKKNKRIWRTNEHFLSSSTAFSFLIFYSTHSSFATLNFIIILIFEFNRVEIPDKLSYNLQSTYYNANKKSPLLHESSQLWLLIISERDAVISLGSSHMACLWLSRGKVRWLKII